MFAAWFEVHSDDAVANHPTALRVYARLMRNPRIFTQPQDVKAWALARDLHVERKSVSAAISLLINRGYVIEHGRSAHNVRRLTLALERTPPIQGASR